MERRHYTENFANCAGKSLQNGYDLNGNMVQKIDRNGSVISMAYDGLNRLIDNNVTNISIPEYNASVSYSYALTGNRLSVSGGSSSSYAYDSLGRLARETEGQITKIIKPIEPGENEGITALVLGEGTDDAGVTISGYDGFNRLIKVTTGNMTATYVYNGDGLRISKTVNGIPSRQVWDGDKIALELDGRSKYIRGVNLISSETGAGTNKCYYLFNGHGDTIQLADASGNVTKGYDYDAFGNELNIDNNDTNPFRYSGEYFDKETGTIYLRARYYNPTIGRFTQKDTHWNPSNMIYGDNPVRINERLDPLGLNVYTYVPDINAIKQSTNLYVYCGNNPVLCFLRGKNKNNVNSNKSV